MSAPACEGHRELVGRVLEVDPSDIDLLRYAEEVPGCSSCQRELAIALRVHPKVIEQGGQSTADAAWDVLTEPLTPPASVPDEQASRWVLAAAAGVLLTLAALAALVSGLNA